MTPDLAIVKAACESFCLFLLSQPAQSLNLLDMALSLKHVVSPIFSKAP